MPQHLVQCRICKQKFDTNVLERDVDWVRIGQKSYYHKKCFEGWTRDRQAADAIRDDDFWYEALIDYLYRDIQMTMDFSKIKSQWTNLIKKGRTSKGIYFSLKYFYEVQKGDPAKAQGGIGIVSSVYNDAAQYWSELEHKRKGIIDSIIQQIASRESRPIINMPRKTKKEKKIKFDLNNI